MLSLVNYQGGGIAISCTSPPTGHINGSIYTGFYPSQGVWYNLVLQQDSNGINFYVNGQLYQQYNGYTNSDNVDNFRIEVFTNGGNISRELLGNIDDLQIWNYS